MNRLKLIQTGVLLILISAMLNSCQLIGDIFKTGVWVGVLIVVGIIFLIFYFVGKSRK